MIKTSDEVQTIRVCLESNGYEIHVGKEILPKISDLLDKNKLFEKVLIVTNKKIEKLYRKKLIIGLKKSSADIHWLAIPDGEKFKTLATVEKILSYLIKIKADRNTSVFALGGGVAGDITGFAASMFMRGIPYYQIPTTLLSQVDSSVGGKTGVDLAAGKNLIGAFYQPKGVFIDTSTLKTLPEREFLCGIAEVIKYAVIADSSFGDFLEQNVKKILKRESEILAYIIATSCRIKAGFVEKDEKETLGLRAHLNFGHTIGHAVESATGYKRFKHGEAVAIGMAAVAGISVKLGFTKIENHDRIKELLLKFGLPVEIPKDITAEKLIKYIKLDKKAAQDKIKMVLMKSIGEVFLHPMTPMDIKNQILTQKTMRGKS